jgi:hypothetical protein
MFLFFPTEATTIQAFKKIYNIGRKVQKQNTYLGSQVVLVLLICYNLPCELIMNTTVHLQLWSHLSFFTSYMINQFHETNQNYN